MHSFMLPVQLVDKVLDVPVVVLRQVLRSMVQKTVVVPQLLSIESRRHSFRAAETDPHGPHRWSMPPLCCRACLPRSCRQRQFTPKAGCAGYDAPRLCSSWLSQAKIFGILVGMDQKDSCSGIFQAGVAGDHAPRAVFSSLVRRPMMLGITAVMDQKDSCSDMFMAGIADNNAPRAVLSSSLAGP